MNMIILSWSETKITRSANNLITYQDYANIKL